ncbi:hypothetical protein VHEMI10620 [[Torrubiella] hemipterigena]|uniref:Uncharacterized protein n=1 Tax=[Torrubiella] hemipterigena TaxID=1531966 RepID=A0A0A1TDL6_9HYPO|nr:hypothetical protein VHEMI10620 [[Torrubiella] hemipterigena]
MSEFNKSLRKYDSGAKEGSYNDLSYEKCRDSADDSFMDDDDDCLHDIEKVITEAIANVEHGNTGNDTIRVSKTRNTPGNAQGCFENLHDKLFATVGPSSLTEPAARRSLKRAANSFDSALKTQVCDKLHANVSRTSSQTSKWTLDPALAEFTALLSSFDRLAKSPFTHTDDEDEVVSTKPKSSNHLEILDRIALEGNVYQKRHRRNRAALCASTVGFSSDKSTVDLQLTDDETISMTPKPLSPQKKETEAPKCNSLMKDLPPLPLLNASSSTIPALREADDETHSAEDGAHLKLKLRINGSVSSLDPGSPREQVGEHADAQQPRQKLRLKISRTQLGQGKNKRYNGNSKSSRLKNCNSLADLAPDAKWMDQSNGNTSTCKPALYRKTSLDVIEDENARRESLQSLDQFNLSYPPSPKKQDTTSRRIGSSGELKSMKSDFDLAAKHRLRQKLSSFKLRFTGMAAPAAAKLVQPT